MMLACPAQAGLSASARAELLGFYSCGASLADDELEYMAEWANATKQDPCMMSVLEFDQNFRTQSQAGHSTSKGSNPPVASVYGNAEGCARHSGRPHTVTDGTVLLNMDDQTLMFHETTCTVDSFAENGMGNMMLQTTCSGEGSVWSQQYRMDKTMNPNGYMVGQPDAFDWAVQITPCE